MQQFFTGVPCDLQELRVDFEKGAVQSDSADSHRGILQRNAKLLLSAAGGFLGPLSLCGFQFELHHAIARRSPLCFQEDSSSEGHDEEELKADQCA